MTRNLTRYQVNGTSALNVDVRSGIRNNVIEFPGSGARGFQQTDHRAPSRDRSRARVQARTAATHSRERGILGRIGYELFEGNLSGKRLSEQPASLEMHAFGVFVVLTMAVSLVVGM